MKILSLTFCLSLLVLPVVSQIAFDEEKQAAVMEGVIEVENVSQEELYNRAKLWMAGNLKSSDAQSLFDEENHEQIVTNGNLLLSNKAMQINRSVNFKLSVFFKKGRFKYVIDQMIVDATNTSLDGSNKTRFVESVNEVYEKYHRKNQKKKKAKSRYKIMDELDEEFGKLVGNLQSSLSQTTEPDSSDW